MGLKKEIKNEKGLTCNYWYIDSASYKNGTNKVNIILVGYADEIYRIKDKKHDMICKEYNVMCEKGIDYNNEEEVARFSELSKIAVPEYDRLSLLNINTFVESDILDIQTLYNKIKELPVFVDSEDV